MQLNEPSRADIEWWHTFLAKRNGISVLRKPSLFSPEVQLHSDASGSWGCGAVWGAVWFQVSWHRQVPRKFGLSSIAVKELLPIILAAGIWGPHWRGCTVCCCCDNEAVVSVVNSGVCRDKEIAHLMRCLFFIEAHFDFSLVAKHVPGVSNIEADTISRDDLRAFFASNPQAHPLPTAVNSAFLRCLMEVEPNWMSADWISWFSSTFGKP